MMNSVLTNDELCITSRSAWLSATRPALPPRPLLTFELCGHSRRSGSRRRTTRRTCVAFFCTSSALFLHLFCTCSALVLLFLYTCVVLFHSVLYCFCAKTMMHLIDWDRAAEGPQRGLRVCASGNNNDEFCIKTHEFCIKNDAFCIKNDEFCCRTCSAATRTSQLVS